MNTTKAREVRLRRTAERQGLTLVKSRRRDPRALGFGTYGLYRSAQLVTGDETGFGLTLDAVEEYLTTDRGTDPQSDSSPETAAARHRTESTS